MTYDQLYVSAPVKDDISEFECKKIRHPKEDKDVWVARHIESNFRVIFHKHEDALAWIEKHTKYQTKFAHYVLNAGF